MNELWAIISSIFLFHSSDLDFFWIYFFLAFFKFSIAFLVSIVFFGFKK